MLQLQHIHHIAIICRDYEKSKDFYTRILGFRVVAEHYRAERKSYKLDLSLNGQYCIELFSFPSPPARISGPEACGLRHLAFQVPHVEDATRELSELGIVTEPIRTDEYTGRKFTFFRDPDNLPLELYEVA
jgi:glyoxylase I family protein